MQKPVRDLQMNFDPPSDFVGESSSGGRRWLKWLGIGCAGISLIIALIMVFGGFKMVSCCSELLETGKMTIAVEEFSKDFARSVQNQDFEGAYALTSVENYQSTTSLDAFSTQFAVHETLLARAMPVVSNIQVLGTSKQEGPGWDVSVRFLPPDGAEILTMALVIGGSAPKDKEAPPRFEVYSVRLETRTRDISAEEPAVAAAEFQNLLRRGDYEAAYARFGRDVAVGETLEEQEADAAMSQEAFKLFVNENASVLTREVTEVVRVEYSNSNEALVSLRVVDANQESVLIVYKMARLTVYGGWKVYEIAPQLQTGELAGAVEEGSAEGLQESASDVASE